MLPTPAALEIDIDEEKLSGGLFLKDGGQVAMQLVQRQMEFPVGAVLKLQPRDLTDVFVTFWTGVQNLRGAFEKFIAALKPGGPPPTKAQ